VEENWYAILSVPRDATDQDIKLAYRELALIHHPDRNPGNAESARKFMRVNAAYKALSDPKERHLYDQELDYAERQAAQRAKPTRVFIPKPAAPDKRRGRAWTANHVMIAAGALLAARGFLGVYAVTWAGFLERWLSLGGGRDRAFIMMLTGIAIALFGLGR
jgi:curved DNA-binding protein CbpA